MGERLLLGLLGACLLGGCVEHRAAITVPEDGPEPITVVETRAAAMPLTAAMTQQDGLPLELRASAWHRDPQAGTISRHEMVVTTDRPWWQRFPADLVSDLLVPKTFIVEQTATVSVQAVAPMDSDTLTELAIQHGYGGQAAMEEP